MRLFYIPRVILILVLCHSESAAFESLGILRTNYLFL